MKKLFYLLVLTTTFFACQTKTETSPGSDAPANATGYNLDSTENIAKVQKMINELNGMDTARYRSYYASDAIFHDNLDSTTLDQNISMFNSFKTNGISIKVTSVGPIWEVVNKKASPTGVTNYVISYQFADFTKGDKTVKVVMNSVDAFKDGKIVEEWNTYDTRKIAELMK